MFDHNILFNFSSVSVYFLYSFVLELLMLYFV